jgi:hypothetical protein
MTEQQRQRLAGLLMHGISPEESKEIAEMAAEDVRKLEPVIDDMVQEALQQGKQSA